MRRLLVVVGITLLSKGQAYKIPVYFDSTNDWHRDIQYHPEQPARIEACVKKLNAILSDAVELIDIASDSGGNLKVVSAKREPFSAAELDRARAMLVRAHSAEHVRNLESRCRNSRQARLDQGKIPLGYIGRVDEDTYLTTESFDVCLRAAAAWIRAADTAMGHGERRPTFALTRPPGHHATVQTSNGFCLINFAAAAAIHVMDKYPEAKVSIFDWDVHYGQGVAQILAPFNRTRYVSVHQSPAFPYMGAKKRVEGPYNNTFTIPIAADTTWTCGYQQVFQDDVLPFLCSQGEWEPQILIVCAGYDALDSDELASVALNANDYGKMTQRLLRQVGRNCGVTFGLEGGYQLSEMAGGGNLADAVVETIRAAVEGYESS